MKKELLTEIILLLTVTGVSIGLYQLIYGISLSYDNYFDMLTFEVRRTTIILEIIGIFLLPIHISINIARQLYFRFLKRYLAFEILIGCILLAGLLFYKYLFLSSDKAAMANEGWTIYPPMTGVPILDEYDSIKLLQQRRITLVKITLVLLTCFIMTFITFRRQKKH